MHKSFVIIIAVLAMFVLVTACNKKSPPVKQVSESVVPTPEVGKTRTYNLSPVGVLREGQMIGAGTIVTDQYGSYLISASHVFSQGGNYAVTKNTSTKEVFRYVVAAEACSYADFIVCFLGDGNHTLLPITSKPFEDRLTGLMKKGGNFNFTTLREKREILANGKEVTASARWDAFNGVNVEVLDCYLGHGWSGCGIIQKDATSEIFYVVNGEFPKNLKDQAQQHLGMKTPEGFTLVSGLSWTEIETLRHNLLSRK